MKFDNYDLCLITDEKERLYFTGFDSSDGFLVLSRDKKIFVIDSRYFYAAKERLYDKGFEIICGRNFSVLKEIVDKLGASVIGIDYSVTTVNDYMALKQILDPCKLCNIEDELRVLATTKRGDEIENIKKACKIAEESFFETIKNLKAGMTEREVAAELEYNFKKHGASKTSFDTIVAFNENSAVPHHETCDDVLKENSVVLMDFGCIYNGYCSDMTRTFFFGSGKPPQKFLDVYDAVYEAHMAGYNEIKPGITGGNADGAARAVLIKRGYGDRFTHSLGHGVGIHIHEYPQLAPAKDNILDNNMVFSNEPGVYFDGEFGVRIEDTVCLLDGRLETFMNDDKKLIVVKEGNTEKYTG